MGFLRETFSIYFCGLAMALMCSSATVTPTIKLSSARDMPVIGLGTWQIELKDIEVAVISALENGYRHIDTAFFYNNEEAIGKALKKWFDKGNKREDLFITTKLPAQGNRDTYVEIYLKDSLKKLGLDYIDMYLIHAPVGLIKRKDSLDMDRNPDGSLKIDYDTDHIAIWKAMEAQVKAGRAKSIGLSNFNETQIQKIIDNAAIKPSNLQIELQAYNQQKQLRDFCKTNNIAVTAYSSLGSPGTDPNRQSQSFQSLPKLMENPVVTKIAKTHNKSPAQVLLRHQVQEGIIVIPKSTKPHRIKENINIFDFELTQDELKELDGLDKGETGRINTLILFQNHPYYPWSAQIPKA